MIQPVNPIKNIEELLKNIDATKLDLKQQLSSVIAELLEQAIKAELEKGVSCNLSNSYPVDNLPKHPGKLFEVSFMLYGGEIYKEAFDPSSDIIDTGESYGKTIPKGEFLKWAEEDFLHAIDAYNHLNAYLKRAPLKSEDVPVDSYF